MKGGRERECGKKEKAFGVKMSFLEGRKRERECGKREWAFGVKMSFLEGRKRERERMWKEGERREEFVVTTEITQSVHLLPKIAPRKAILHMQYCSVWLECN